MCVLTAFVAPRCRHTTKYEYKHCAGSPYPKRCPELIESVAKCVADETQAWCTVCWRDVKEKMTADFHAERRMVTSTARAEGCWSDDEISQMRMELRDQYYEKVKYANRPLPSLPNGYVESPASGIMSGTTMGVDAEEAAVIREQLKE